VKTRLGYAVLAVCSAGFVKTGKDDLNSCSKDPATVSQVHKKAHMSENHKVCCPYIPLPRGIKMR
jgi:hypothetical protein